MAHPSVERNGGYTYADYLTWSDDERWEIIDGVAYNMSPSPTPVHQEALLDLGAQLRSFLRGKTCRVFPELDVLLPRCSEGDNEIHTVVRPDISVVCDPEKIVDNRVRGAPDFVIEIISPSSASYDHIKKKHLYECAGVKEYWVVDPGSRSLTVYLLDSITGRYPEGSFHEEPGRIAVASVPGLDIDFSTVFPPLPKSVREPPSRYAVKPD